MTWLRWGALNLGRLALVMAGGLLLLVPAALVGWGTADTREYTYLFLWLYLPFTGTAYLVLLALVGRRARRPRLWALALTPLFWGFVPIFAIGVAAPGIAATWVAYLVYGAVVELPPRAVSLAPGA